MLIYKGLHLSTIDFNRCS